MIVGCACSVGIGLFETFFLIWVCILVFFYLPAVQNWCRITDMPQIRDGRILFEECV